MKLRYGLSLLIAIVLVLALTMPVMAVVYYAYLRITESSGNSYTNLAMNCSRNITQLIAYDLMSSTGLDTRVLTGDSEPLPHMLANDRIMFVSDLEAYEDKTLIFYLGAASLANFPIVVGHNGYITTDDDPSMEVTYIMQLVASGYFDSSADTNKNVVYKEDAFRIWIPSAGKLRVAWLEAGGAEQWALQDNTFSSAEHSIYVVTDGLGAYLYVDDFDLPVDTENLYDTYEALFNVDYDGRFTGARKTFYANGRYWAFYAIGGTWFGHIYYRTSTDGQSWTSETSIGIDSGTDFQGFGVWFDGTFFHVGYGDKGENNEPNGLRYRQGTPNANGSITWSAVWQSVPVGNGDNTRAVIAADNSGYPYIRYIRQTGAYSYAYEITKSSTKNGTWTTAGGYPAAIVGGGRGCLIGFPDSDKMYMIRFQTTGIQGRYYNGSTWGASEETIDPSVGTCALDQLSLIADNDDNVVFVWRGGTWAGCGKIMLRIRYADGTFSSILEIVSSGAETPSISYDPATNMFYVFYVRDGAVKVRTLDLVEAEIGSEYHLFAPDDINYIATTPYSSNIGILYVGLEDITAHGYLSIPHEWEENESDWLWMQNNVMPYADYLWLAVDGEEVLEYEPTTIIQGTALPDKSVEGNHGVITWGANPVGVAVSLGPLSPEEAVGPPDTMSEPGAAPPPDMTGESGQPGWTRDTGTLTTHPFYPIIAVVSDNMNIPIGRVWIIAATLIMMLIMIVSFRYAPHQMITVFAGGGWTAFCYHQGIYPFWVIFIFVLLGIAIIVGERSPVVS